MSLQIIDPTNYAGWDDLLLSTPGHSFFHSSAWARVLKDSYGYTPLYFTEFVNGRISKLIPIMEVNSILTGKKGVSLPFTDYCEPIIDDHVHFQQLYDQILNIAKERKWKYFELRGGARYFSAAIPNLFYYIHVLNLLKDERDIYSSFRSNTKRNIKKAIKNGVEVKISNSLESIKEYYRLNCMTRKEHGLPGQPYTFFKKIYEHIISNNLGFVALAAFRGKTIAGAVFFHFGEKAIFKYGASDLIYQIMRPNNLVMWEGIKWYRKNGYKRFYFGRTEPVNIGLRRFKKGWGTEEYKINYYNYDLGKGSYTTNTQEVSAFQKIIFKNMPTPFLKIIGSMLYKYMG